MNVRLLVIGALAATLSASGATCMASVGSNYSDLWWNPAESGWGASVLQQSDGIVVNLFVYAAGGLPAWYSASATSQGTDAQGHVVFVGDLYRTSGPPPGDSFKPDLVSYRKVGTLTFDADSVDTASLAYTVDGVAVSKKITRQLWKYEDFTGNYYGAFIYDYTPLHAPCIDIHGEESGPISVAQTGHDMLTMTIASSLHSCTFTGDYTQAGHMGTSQGTFLCSDSLNGSYTAFEMERNANGFTGRLAGQSRFCAFTGRFGGVLR